MTSRLTMQLELVDGDQRTRVRYHLPRDIDDLERLVLLLTRMHSNGCIPADDLIKADGQSARRRGTLKMLAPTLLEIMREDK